MARKTGTSTAGIETSPRWERKRRRIRKAEEADWAARSGPVTVRYLDQALVDEDQPGTVDAGASSSSPPS